MVEEGNGMRSPTDLGFGHEPDAEQPSTLSKDDSIDSLPPVNIDNIVGIQDRLQRFIKAQQDDDQEEDVEALFKQDQESKNTIARFD